MSRSITCVLLAAWAVAGFGAERPFSFDLTMVDQSPPGFRTAVSGTGRPGEWKIILEDSPSALPSLSGQSAPRSRRPVLAQLARDPESEHFPLLVFEGDTYGDFTFSTRFKLVEGTVEQMAGLAFRIQDEKNYYVVRASALGRSFRFYKFVEGRRSNPIGPEVEIPKGVWHELAVDCRGNQIRCLLNGQELIPPLTDNSFAAGKVGFWTKSDSISYFADAKISYTPRETLAQVLVREAVQKYDRMTGVALYARANPDSPLLVIASSSPADVGRPGGKVEQDVIARNIPYQGKDGGTASVVLPLHDQNGEPMAAVRIRMKSFLGQTEQNAIARALPVVRGMERRVRTLPQLLE